MKKIAVMTIMVSSLLAGCCSQSVPPAIKRDGGVERQVNKMLKNMTLEEKIGQMSEVAISMVTKSDANPVEVDQSRMDKIFGELKIGSILNTPEQSVLTAAEWNKLVEDINKASIEQTGIPTIYGIDGLHGSSYTRDAQLFPQTINMAATFNREIARQYGEHAAYEIRASNIPWTYGPSLDLGRRQSWSRLWEGMGEDAYLAGEIGRSIVMGLQGDDPNHVDQHHVAACLKHYMAYGAADNGKDRTPASVSIPDLREKYFAPYVAAVKSGALSIMVNSASVNGVPVHASHELLTEWLKEGLNWDGMVVSDWNDIVNLYTREKVAKDYKEAVEMSINAGIDMSMIPYDVNFCSLLKELVDEGRVSMERIDDAVSRVLRLKVRLGLLDTPNTYVNDYPEFAGSAVKNASYETACESITLLKNSNNILPLNPSAKVLVCGPNASSMRTLNGGWTYTWQGSTTDKILPNGTTIVKAMQSRGGVMNVKYVAGVEYDMESGDYRAEKQPDIASAVAAAQSVDCVVLCLGENSYCETPGNLDDLTISVNQQELAKALIATGKPVVLVLNEGRPRLVSSFVEGTAAVIQTYLPGNEGAEALADIIYGTVTPSGKLPYTYPKYPNALSTYDHKHSEQQDTMEGAYDYNAVVSVQWAFGYGLSYTTFDYSDLNIESLDFGRNDEVKVSVRVTNSGNCKGKEVVMLFVNDDVASVIPDARRLREFEKIELQPGQSKVVDFVLPAKRLAFVGSDGKWHLERGTYSVQCGNLSGQINCTETVVLDDYYN